MEDITIPGGRHAEAARRIVRAYGLPDGQPLEGDFPIDGPDEIDEAVRAATAAFPVFGSLPGSERAAFLEAIADEIDALGDALVERARAETALPAARLAAERGRTTGQLRLFANLLRSGDWQDTVTVGPDAGRQPLPRPDLRQTMIPLGPVAVFGAGNFPLAFSTAGGDTASALAAGCPVVLKAHEGHLGTNRLVSDAILRAGARTGMPPGVFTTLIGEGHATGRELVAHPGIRAASFTGSPSGGRALFDVACGRPDPIPFFAEMGSTNPVFLLPAALATRAETIATQLATSFTLHAGQYCTNPGIAVAIEGEGLDAFLHTLAAAVTDRDAETMYGPGIIKGYETRSEAQLAAKGVQLLAAGKEGAPGAGQARAARVSAAGFLAHPSLHEEVFGPSTLVVVCRDADELLAVARSLPGQLTATLWGEPADHGLARSLLPLLTERAGRILWNGMPTGVEVSPAMHHGGPWPATTDPRFTSVGTRAIRRWLRPICYQNLPEALLPPELR